MIKKENDTLPRIDLRKKTALITGGSRGIGRSIAIELARCGADVAIVYKKSDGDADSVIETIEAAGVKALKIKCDASSTAQSLKAVEKVLEGLGGVDILVNNVAVSDNMPFLALEAEIWHKAVSVNIDSLYNFTYPVLHHMKDKKYGKILNVGSLCGVRPMAAVPVHYAMTKAAMNAFTYTLAKEVARYNIFVNSIAPGLIETDFASGLPEIRKKDFEKFCPIGRMGTPDEIAKFAAFIVSDLNSYMTGETVVISGGL